MSLPISAGNWTIDQPHSSVEFVVRHLGLSKVRGRFNQFDAKLVVGDTLADTSVTATVDLSTIDTNNPDRDAHLRTTDFFDVANHPTMTFTSTTIAEDGGDYTMTGDLTINGVTNPVTFDVEFNGTETNPLDQNVRAGFSASAEISRKPFGVEFDVPVGGEKLLLGDKIKIELEMQFAGA
ncbi:MAG: YceI family protein [Actinomycetota bacterium]|nr:YceI family protein [Actinomycetota bacterium]